MMEFDKKTRQNFSKYMMYGSILSIALAVVGYLGFDIWLASTQWLLVASVLALFGVYMKLS